MASKYTPLQVLAQADEMKKENENGNFSTIPAYVPATAPLKPRKPLVGPVSSVTECPYCHSAIRTAVRFTTTTRTHIMALFCTFICCCCCIPYCCNSARNSDHYCPNCDRYLGTYEK